MEPAQSTPSSLFDRISPASAISLALGLLVLNSVVQMAIEAWIAQPVVAIALAAALTYLLAPALLWSRLGPGAEPPSTLSMPEDLGTAALAPVEMAWIAAIAVGMLVPLDRLGELNQWIVSPPAAYAEWQQQLLPTSTLQTWLLYLGLAVVVPVGEELVFRGLVQQAVRTLVGPIAASALAGVLFGLLHLEPYFLLPLALTGFLLGLVYEITDTLWAPVLLHVLYNAAVLTLWMQAESDEVPGSPRLLGALSLLGILLVGLALRQLHRLRPFPTDASTSSRD